MRLILYISLLSLFFFVNHACQLEWVQCAGKSYQGETACCSPLTCFYQSDYYSDCRYVEVNNGACQTRYNQCGGLSWGGLTTCCPGLTCVFGNSYYSSCQLIINNGTNNSTNGNTTNNTVINNNSTSNTSKTSNATTNTTKTNTTNNTQVNTTNTTKTNTTNTTKTNTTNTTKTNTTNNTATTNNTKTNTTNITNTTNTTSNTSIHNNFDVSIFTKIGKTTRYWDCCKPSCSWPGKALFSAPVRDCTKDGILTDDSNQQSGCNGGTSYTCIDQQPWIVNNQLAFGFAAGKLAGQSEADSCCACYELYFTGEDNQGGNSARAIAGKRLVVQSTNTGGDLGENHFDLMIPGGGVGIFNGCQAQFGAPSDGWGQRYGGVSSIADCSQLPVSLRSGCQIRFNFLGGADNPSVKFRRVYCPETIIQRSLCRRNDDSNYPMNFD